MNLENVSDYLTYYISIDNPQYAVMLKGKWGCGKTYYINTLINKWNSSIREIKVKEEDIILRPIYVSLNGLNNISQVSFMIRRNLRPFLYSKTARVLKNIFLGSIKTASKGLLDCNNDGIKDDLSDIFDAENIFEIISKPNDFVKGQKVLIFDDLERCKIPIDEIFGFINNLVEHSKCKVILIGEEDKIREQYDKADSLIKYKDFKEKLIGQTLHIQQNYNQIIDSFVRESKNQYLKDNEDLILDIFIASKVENLRILKHCFSDFERLTQSISEIIINNNKFDDFIKNVLAYFVITYCEHKSGNTFILNFQNNNYQTDSSIKAGIRSLEEKYNGILKKYTIKYSLFSLKIETIINFIDNGFIPDLQNIINSNEILNERDIAEWEEIWTYWELDNNAFNKKIKVVKKLFYRNEIEDVSIVIHIAGLLLKFNRLKLITCNENYIIKKAKKQIDNIFRKPINEEKLFVEDSENASWGKQYMECSSKEMIDLINHAKNKLSDYSEEKTILLFKKFWENIENKETINISSILFNIDPSRNYQKNGKSMFSKIDVNKVCSKFIQLSNKSKYNLSRFFSAKYISNNENNFTLDQLDLDFEYLIKIKKTLSLKAHKIKLLDKIATNYLIETLQKCIDKLNELRSSKI